MYSWERSLFPLLYQNLVISLSENYAIIPFPSLFLFIILSLDPLEIQLDISVVIGVGAMEPSNSGSSPLLVLIDRNPRLPFIRFVLRIFVKKNSSLHISQTLHVLNRNFPSFPTRTFFQIAASKISLRQLQEMSKRLRNRSFPSYFWSRLIIWRERFLSKLSMSRKLKNLYVVVGKSNSPWILHFSPAETPIATISKNVINALKIDVRDNAKTTRPNQVIFSTDIHDTYVQLMNLRQRRNYQNTHVSEWVRVWNCIDFEVSHH